MSDIEKIQLIHDLRNKFNLDETAYNHLVDQIKSSKFKDNIQRFFDGYNIEDKFAKLFSLMPWVQLIHSLDQEQFPKFSKDHIQVPDYMLFYETSSISIKPILFEVKSVKGQKENLELMKKQINSLQEYSKNINIKLLVGIYWNKTRTWTINSIDQFEEKAKKYKINILPSMKNDLSVILGDLTFIIPIFYRKSIFDKTIFDDTLPRHEKYGCQTSDSLSFDGNNYFKLEHIESAIIDSSTTVKEINKITNSNITEIVEKTDSPYFYKTSQLVVNFLSMFPIEKADDYFKHAGIIISDFMKKMSISTSYMLPNDRTPTTDILYKEAFDKTWVFNDYINTAAANKQMNADQ